MTDTVVSELTVSEPEGGLRLDRILADRDLGVSRATLQRWIEQGRVTVDGRAARGKDKPRVGSLVRVEPAPPPPSEAEPQDIALDIEFEDDHILVVHKPAGLVVHPAPGHPDGTLVNAVRFHCEVVGGGDPRRPGIVHRLDRDTSGLMVVAKTDRARDGLTQQFQAHTVERQYVAIVQGCLGGDVTYDTLHGRHPHDRKRFSCRVEKGKRAVTFVSRLSGRAEATFVACRLETGRTHQIRVHLSEAGYPLVADPVYGKKANNPVIRAAHDAIGRLALHARTLGFEHPCSGATHRFERRPPPDFMAALASLGFAEPDGSACR